LRRNQQAIAVADLLGREVMVVDDAATGWPASVTVTTDAGPVRVALHVGPVGLSHRDRDDVERRFQNPGSDRPITVKPGELPILLGVWDERGTTVFVALDGRSRVGRETRFSLFAPLELLKAAAVVGWEEGFSTTGERIVAFLPALFPAYVQLLRSDVSIDPASVAIVVAAAGMLDEGGSPAERGRRTVSALVRDAVFSRSVREAYGNRCAMCGLNFSLVVGAHIYPVAAVGAPDEVWNGIALCHNHHAVFDGHMIHVDPGSNRIALHPELEAGVKKSPACEQFVRGTFDQLAPPSRNEYLPRPEMFAKRYAFFPSKYEWAS